ncbi:beta-propeller fold lactonase family protein, partial [Nostoc sp.]|uniref:beta-propeller fold lactonase family protein n=1 Tax=Nostoc sp. TaxID=1180 RepID=UPI002FF6E4A0
MTQKILNFVEVQKDNTNGVDGLGGAKSLTVSPDGKFLYATGYDDSAVAVFERDTTTGALNFVEVQKDNTNGVDGLGGAKSLTVSPDGKFL